MDPHQFTYSVVIPVFNSANVVGNTIDEVVSVFEQAGLRYQVVTKTKSPAVQIENVVRDTTDEDDFRRTALGILRAIDAGVSYPVRGWHCRGCPYQKACAQQSRSSRVPLRIAA